MQIYEPAEDSYLLQKYVRKYAQGRVLDIGTGSGIQALAASKVIDVREVIAIDINKEAIKQLQEKAKLDKKIKPKFSNLFEKVSTKFDTIIFNPPYLPQDKGITDKALYGGKKGYELSEKFFKQASQYLAPKGKILFLFSSLTNKDKIDQFIENNLLEAKLLEKIRIHFEDLFVYLIKKTDLLNELESKGIENIQYLTHGKRGNIFTGLWNKNIHNKKIITKKLVKVAIKTKRKESQAHNRIENEVNWLKVLNNYDLGPKLLFSGKNYFVYKFVEGEFILDWIKKNNQKNVIATLIKIIKQCFILDQLGINKEEMHHPQKHILVSDRVVLLDFERVSRTEKPKNVTQFVEFLVRFKFIKREIVLPLLKKYKKDLSKKNLEKIIKALS